MQDNFDEDLRKDPDEYITRCCWLIADTAERFYPIEETAHDCTVALLGDVFNEEQYEDMLAREKQYHLASYVHQIDLLQQMYDNGFDVRARTEAYLDKMAEESDRDTKEIRDQIALDWDFWEDYRRDRDRFETDGDDD